MDYYLNKNGYPFLQIHEDGGNLYINIWACDGWKMFGKKPNRSYTPDDIKQKVIPGILDFFGIPQSEVENVKMITELPFHVY